MDRPDPARPVRLRAVPLRAVSLRDLRRARPRPARRDPAVLLVVAVVLGLAVVASLAAGRVYRSLDDPTTGLPVRPVFVSAPDPMLRTVSGLDPNSTDVAPGTAKPDVRAVLVGPDAVTLLRGGRVERTVPLARPVTTPAEIAAAVADEEWIRMSTPTEVVVDTALLMQPGTTLTVAAPLRRMVLQARSGVFLGGEDATLRFTGVEVEASDRAVPRQGEVGAGSRPFVLAAGGRMEIDDSTFRYLGRDWNDSYGVSWTKGATGRATGSTFEHGFMGIFAATAIDVRFERNTFRGNALYGINAHELSAGLLIADSLAEGNGRDGILLSDHVTGSEVRGNTSRGNGLNAITLDDGSDRNAITGNVAEGNGGDGIVVSRSSGNTVAGNTVRDNRVAVGVHGGEPGSNAVSGNVLADNGLATQGAPAEGNEVLSNGDYWRPGVLALVWLLAALATALLVRATHAARRRRDEAVARARAARRAPVVAGTSR